MTQKDFMGMFQSLRAAMHKFPLCRIANCSCNSIAGEWRKNCMCGCHFFHMGELHGTGWTLDQFMQEAKVGHIAVGTVTE